MGTTRLGNPGAAQPIRYAEVEVVDAAGKRVQCGETQSDGTVDLNLPLSTNTYFIRVNSRANNSNAVASVLNCPEENAVHYIEGTVVPDANKSVTVNAPADGDVQGGAFNILDQIVEANEFLRSEVSACPFAGCTDFTVAPKVTAYWDKGFNPNTYFGAAQSGISFYLPGYRRLFIMGGIDGDVDNEDTDHFDDSVILHEYGHFLEDVFSNTDSPGGAHSGNAIIDPRLAWSEGWGNFIQGAIRGVADYIDSYGNVSGTTSGLYFNIDIEQSGCGIGSSSSGCDMPAFDYEGNFREFAVTRFLWDVHDSGALDDDADGVNDAFEDIWAVITMANDGFKNTAEQFRNIGLLVEKQPLLSSSNWTTLVADNEHELGDTLEYARYVDNTGTCPGDLTMDPYADLDDSGGFSTSHLLKNNQFYFYKHSGGTLNLTLGYQTDVATDQESDLDLYVYNTSARYGNASDIVANSQDYFDNNAATAETESISKSLPAGDYLINVKVYTGKYSGTGCLGSICNGQRIPAGDPLTLTLTVNGASLCPELRP